MERYTFSEGGPPPLRRDVRSPDAPVVLLAADEEWWRRSLESILAASGYAVYPVTTERQVMEYSTVLGPDAIVIQSRLHDASGPEICRSVRDGTGFDPATPILLIFSSPATREERVAALRSGAWDCLNLPLDAEEFVAKMRFYISARQEASRARAESMFDRETRLYTQPAMLHFGRVLIAEARRRGHPFGCVVFSLEAREPAQDGPAAILRHQGMNELAPLLSRVSRRADVVGLVGPMEFGILATGTLAAGCVRLAERVLAAADSLGGSEFTAAPGLRLRAGCYASDDPVHDPTDAAVIVARAQLALQRIRRRQGPRRIEVFTPPPIG